jgi:two-component system nitrogen regulation sensor histidine kinase GlnL
MPDGGNLYFSSQHDGENILLSIKDVSHGIKEELIDKIFEPVYKDGEEEKTGLGLAIARYILESMNYNLKLESSITGTIYTIVLPKDSH